MRRKSVMLALGATIFIASSAGTTPVTVQLKNQTPSDGVYFTSLWDGFRDGGIEMRNEGTTAPVPEPLSLFLFGTGLAGVACLKRRKTNQQNT